MSEQPEFEPAVAEALERHTPVAAPREDWQDAVRRARPRAGRARVVRAIVATAAVLLLLIVVTPIGGAIREQVADFSDWLAGSPGTAVSEEEQRAFDAANARSWIGFPGSPELRRLIRAERDGVTYDLLGFRSGNSLCVRVTASGEARGSTTLCAPISDLRNDDAPARVLVADWGIGRGVKKETVGFDTYTAPLAQVTAGIAADGVESLELVDDAGRHRVDTESNAFLYVAARPDVGQRVTDVRAQLESGEAVRIPFAVSPWGPGGGYGGGSGKPGGPTRVERVVEGGSIGWVERREERGEPLDERQELGMLREVEFARVLTPDPGSSKRVAIAIGEFRSLRPTGGESGRRGLCTYLITRGGTGGGCGRLDDMFPRAPFTMGYSVIGAGDQFATFAGVASDDVSRLELFTATGNRIEVPLRDNAYLAEVSLARFPAKLVAYDAQERVIGIEETPREQGPARPYGRPVVELEATVEGVGSLALQALRTREGGECWSARGTGKASVRTGSCVPKEWVDAPIRLGTLPDPAVFLYGRVRSDIERLELSFADGKTSEITPSERGYVLTVLPREQRRAGRELVEVVGRGAGGEIVARRRLKP